MTKNVVLNLPAVARRGADGVWLEECYTDMYSPKTFAEFNAPLVKEIVDEAWADKLRNLRISGWTGGTKRS